MAGKKRKEKSVPPQHRVALDADDSVVSKKRARPPKHHQSADEVQASLSVPCLTLFWPSNSNKDESFALLQLISSGLSSKILKEAINQQKEILQEAEEENHTPFSAVSIDPTVASDSDAEDADAFDDVSETQSQYDVDEVSCFCPVEIDEEDEKLLAAFMSTKSGSQPTLADIIIQRIKEKEAEITSVREDISKNKRLHFALYQALKKSLYKPAAFFKGVLLPLCQVTPEIRRELKHSRNRGEEDDSLRSPFSVINKPIEEDRWDFPEVPMEED
ncbi:hypothetical protein BHE74_00006562 [Ensete ventricosum]|nr:hypothetical protein BHE74_00006562 [Ensete ventricosum]